MPTPFLVIATQNPIDLEGAYQLPEAQLDRLLMRLSLGYADLDTETEILAGRARATAQAFAAGLGRHYVVARACPVLILRELLGRVVVNATRNTRSSCHCRLPGACLSCPVHQEAPARSRCPVYP